MFPKDSTRVQEEGCGDFVEWSPDVQLVKDAVYNNENIASWYTSRCKCELVANGLILLRRVKTNAALTADVL